MFTSRAEWRLMLRQDNADLRLTEKGYELGVVPEARWQAFMVKRDAIAQEQQRLSGTLIRPNSNAASQLAESLGETLSRESHLLDLLKRPHMEYHALLAAADLSPVADTMVAEQVAIQARYQGYLSRQQMEVARLRNQENTHIPAQFDFTQVGGFSQEIVQKMQQIRPSTVGQASRIPGVTPAAISQLLIYLKRCA